MFEHVFTQTTASGKQEFTQRAIKLSIATEARVTALERQLVEQRIELMAQIAALQVRLEMIEARKPGPKPKDSQHG